MRQLTTGLVLLLLLLLAVSVHAGKTGKRQKSKQKLHQVATQGYSIAATGTAQSGVRQPAKKKKPKIKRDKRRKGRQPGRIAIIGDSLVGTGSGLEMGLRQHAKKKKHKVKRWWRLGARPRTYIKSTELHQQIVIEYNPTIIVVVLGMNSVRTPVETVKRDVRLFYNLYIQSHHDCFWVGPPPLVDGTGYFLSTLATVVLNNTHCRYFDTAKQMKFGPSSVSGFHVKRWKGRRWANKVWDWMSIAAE